MAGDEQQQPGEAGGAEEVREHEDRARRARTEREAERAAAEREQETGREGGEDPIVPTEPGDEGRGFPPPAGSGHG